MSDVAEMVTRIEGHLNRGNKYRSEVNDAIVDAVKFYKDRRFHFNTKRATASTVASQEYYALPADLIEVDMIRVLYSSGAYSDPLDEVTYRWIERHRTNVSYTSQPEKFALQGLDLRLWPVPDAAYTLTMTYHRDIGGFSATLTSTLSNEWTTDAEPMIRFTALADVLENTIGGPEASQAAQTNQRRANAWYKSLRRKANRRESSGKLMPKL